MTDLTMVDGVDVSAWPATTTLGLVYVDGAQSMNVHEAQARFPNAQLVTITTQPPGMPGAQFADVEGGDLSPDDGLRWSETERANGRYGGLYSAFSTWNGPPPNGAPWFYARPDGVASRDPRSVATQYAWSQLGQCPPGIDLSLCVDAWPFAPVQPPPPVGGPDMLTSFIDPKDGSVHVCYLATNGHVIELFRGTPGEPAWHFGDLTQQTGSPVAAT